MRIGRRILNRIVAWKWRILVAYLLLLGASYLLGPTALVLFALLALATLITEDLTCVWAGVLAAEGRIGFGFAVTACLFGIVVGDILLFLAGRLFGRTLLRHRPLKWFVRSSDVERSSAWFRRRGMMTIVLSRFLPGTRLPTYVAAGLLNTSLSKFSLYFFIAAAVWTPMLVGASMLLGREVIESALVTHQYLVLRLAITALLLFTLVKLLLSLTTFRGRRLLLARWRRLTRWEFWPPWALYPPVVLYVAYLGLKHRCLSLFTYRGCVVIGTGSFKPEEHLVMSLSKGLNILDWILRIVVAVVLVQTLFFKFTGAKESIAAICYNANEGKLDRYECRDPGNS